MAEVTSRSQKRKPSTHDNLENEQRLAKRFDLLNIEHNGKRYIPVPAEQQGKTVLQSSQSKPKDDDMMHLEDTKDKIYIHNLDAELAELESDEENPIFIPDIEKHLNKLQKQILVSQEPRSLVNNQLVLYGVPNSLTVPEEKDSVRKAIIEARERARERQACGDVQDTVEMSPPVSAAQPTHALKAMDIGLDDDDMDLD